MSSRSVRTRLALLYAGLFLLTTTVLIVVVSLLLRAMLDERLAELRNAPPPEPLPPLPTAVPSSSATPVTSQHADIVDAVGELSEAVIRFQWGIAAAVIAVLTLCSVGTGWWLSGRVLRPLGRITATARRLSVSNLSQRIALDGRADELKELADTFDSMLDRLERSVESQRHFIAHASHELRTPLAVQRAAIEIGLDDPSPERLAQLRGELLAINRRSERLIDGLLTLAQSDRGLESVETLALDELVAQTVDEVPAGAVTMDVRSEPAIVTGDPVLLATLVANLVRNAIQYNQPSGTVEVRVTARGTLSVRNTGPIVPNAHVPDLLKPFRRHESAENGNGEGVGLGLSIVASVARAHQAELTVEPNRGGGLVVTVHFDV